MKIYSGYSPNKSPQRTLDEMEKSGATHVRYVNIHSNKTFLMSLFGVKNEVIQKSLASRAEKELSAKNSQNEVVEIQTQARDEYLYEMDILGVDEIEIIEGFGKRTIIKRKQEN
jgi:hypothetical protein